MAGQGPQSILMKHIGIAAGSIKMLMGTKGFFEQKAEKGIAKQTRAFSRQLTEEYAATGGKDLSNVAGAIGIEADHMARNGGQRSGLSEKLGLGL